MDSTLFDEALANLRGLSHDIRAVREPAGHVAAALRDWSNAVDTAVADLLEVRRRARYAEVLALADALVDVTVDGSRMLPNVPPTAGGDDRANPARTLSSPEQLALPVTHT